MSSDRSLTDDHKKAAAKSDDSLQWGEREIKEIKLIEYFKGANQIQDNFCVCVVHVTGAGRCWKHFDRISSPLKKINICIQPLSCNLYLLYTNICAVGLT